MAVQAQSRSLADFKQQALLGEGAYSSVYKVVRLADKGIYALKKVKLPSLSDKEKENALNEVRLLASVRHENVIAYKEAFFDDKTRCLCIITECADSGDLAQQIKRCQKDRVHPKETDVWRYLYGMCHGLKALHDMRILHRDLKCANIFLSTQGGDGTGDVIAKLGDFNVSKVAKRGLCMTQTGTPYYASPEVWRDMPYDAKSDMWSLGCVLYEMVALKPPFQAEDMEGLYRKVLKGQYPRIPAHFSNDLAEVIGVLLQVNPRHRPSVEQLLQMPVIRRHISQNEALHEPLDLLSTIKLPKNIIDVTGCMPAPQYDIDYNTLSPSVVRPSASSPFVGDASVKLLPRSINARSQPNLPTQSECDMVPPPKRGLENCQDSLDAYMLSPPPPTTPLRKQPPPDTYNNGNGGPQGYPAPAPPVQQQQQQQQQQQHQPSPGQSSPAHRQLSNQMSLPQINQNRDNPLLPPINQDRDSLDTYVQRQNAPAQQRRLPSEAGESGIEDSYRRGSPAPSSQGGANSRVVYGRQPVYGGQQYRHPRANNERKPMASYARPQYAMNSGSGSASQALPTIPQRQNTGGGAAAPPRQPTGGGSRGPSLRLPRIFTKAS